MQKKLLITLVLFFMTSAVCLSAPNYDPNMKTKIYDDSYNRALYKKLKDNYEKKYPAVITQGEYGPIYTYYNRPLNSYHNEVTTPYYEQQDNEYHYINE